MADHEHGQMDISTQEKTFEGFLQGCLYVAIATTVILVFLAIVGT
ncbi:MAG: aa3-type cytochrome c oxidase subunit IV [Pseudomonadota bacterium]